MKKVIGVILLIIFFSTGTASAAVFTKNLYFGLENDSEILKLQEFLTTEGLYSGPITGNFYSLTLKGVKAFQTKHDITPVGGFFGPLTRGKANTIIDSQLSGSESQAIIETGSPSPIPQIKTDTTQLQLSALLAQLELLQKQLNAQQQAIQGTQNVQTNTTLTQQPTTPIVLPNDPQPTQTPSTSQTSLDEEKFYSISLTPSPRQGAYPVINADKGSYVINALIFKIIDDRGWSQFHTNTTSRMKGYMMYCNPLQIDPEWKGKFPYPCPISLQSDESGRLVDKFPWFVAFTPIDYIYNRSNIDLVFHEAIPIPDGVDLYYYNVTGKKSGKIFEKQF